MSNFEKLLYYVLKLKEENLFGLNEKVLLFRELSFLIEGGLSLVESINTIRTNTSSISIRIICDEIYEKLQKGENLHRTMLRLNKYFNNGDINIIKSGENSGELQKVLRYLSEEYEFLIDIRNKYFSAMIYPAFVFVLSLVAIYIILKFVFPSIVGLVDQFEGLQLPWSTLFLINVSNFLIHYSYYILIFIFFVGFGLFIVYSFDEGRKFIERKMVGIPLIGKITKYYNLIKFLRYLRLLLNAGINYFDIFTLLKQIINNSIYQDMFDDILIALRKGESFTDILPNYDMLVTPEAVSLIKVGEKTANLIGSIDKTIRFYEQEFNKIINSLSKVIEPIMIIFVGFVVGFISISVFGIIGNVLDSLQL